MSQDDPHGDRFWFWLLCGLLVGLALLAPVLLLGG